MVFWTWLGNNRNQSVAQVPELWMACRVSEVCGERDQGTGQTHLCSHLIRNPLVERAQVQGQVGVNLPCPQVGALAPILSGAAFRLGRGMQQRTSFLPGGCSYHGTLVLTGGHNFKGPLLSCFKSSRSPQFSPSPKHLTLSHDSVF